MSIDNNNNNIDDTTLKSTTSSVILDNNNNGAWMAQFRGSGLMLLKNWYGGTTMILVATVTLLLMVLFVSQDGSKSCCCCCFVVSAYSISYSNDKKQQQYQQQRHDGVASLAPRRFPTIFRTVVHVQPQLSSSLRLMMMIDDDAQQQQQEEIPNPIATPIIQPPPPSLKATDHVKRRDWLLRNIMGVMILGTITTAASTTTNVAHAVMDSDNIVVSQLKSPAALQSIQLAYQTWISTTMVQYITQRNYLAFQAALRSPPLSELRKSSRILILASGGGDANDSINKRLSQQYTTLIQSIEQMDRLALSGARSSSISSSSSSSSGNAASTSTDDPFQLLYESTKVAFNTFVTTAEQSAQTYYVQQ